MVTDAFGALLQELGKIIKIPDLQPDSNYSCLIKFPIGISVQIEMTKGGTSLMMACDLGLVAPGRFRENVFREALMANGLPPPRNGDFSYSQKTDHLLLTSYFPLKELNGEKLAAGLIPFMEKAKIWQEAIQRGDIPSHDARLTTAKGSGMFGLK